MIPSGNPQLIINSLTGAPNFYQRVCRGPMHITCGKTHNFILGPPGSGKTSALFQRAQEIQTHQISRGRLNQVVHSIIPEGADRTAFIYRVLLEYPNMVNFRVRQMDSIRSQGKSGEMDLSKIPCDPGDVVIFNGFSIYSLGTKYKGPGLFGDGKSIEVSDFLEIDRFCLLNPEVEVWLEYNSPWIPPVHTPYTPPYFPPMQVHSPSKIPEVEITSFVCECGAERARTPHSNWCPKYVSGFWGD